MPESELENLVRTTVGEALAARDRKINRLRDLAVELNVARLRTLPVETPLRDVEFRVFSQNGEDGIIQFLLARCPTIPDSFIEFGVETYAEANTRLLLERDNWRGLILDCDPRLEAEIPKQEFYWRHDLTAVSAVITRDNINGLIADAGFAGPLGLLSIDVDGNDYWIWEAIDCVEPAIVVAEYNSVFGAELPISVPYRPDFVRTNAHYSNLYFGCSLAALCFLAERKGYDFVGSNSFGNNAFFLRRDLGHPFRRLSAREGHVTSRFRESRDRDGRLSFLGGAERRRAIAEMPVIDVTTGRERPLGIAD